MQVMDEELDDRSEPDRQELALRVRLITGALKIGPGELVALVGQNRATWRRLAAGQSFPSRTTVRLFVAAVREKAAEAGSGFADLTPEILLSRYAWGDFATRAWSKRFAKVAAA